MIQLGVRELAAWLADPARPRPLLLDVREPWEVARVRIEGSMAVPLAGVAAAPQALGAPRPVVCICHHGGRSAMAARVLEGQGWPEVYNLAGGIDAWARQVDPSLPLY